jgi:uncharacterized protein YchJ
MWDNASPVPLEESDPELAEFFRQVSNKEVPYIVHHDEIYNRHTGGIAVAGSTVKVKRNDPCTCGSGKKYKKCCGRK